jgi:hypothetical protein
MSFLLRLYPKAWRERYGAELADLLARERLTPRLALDLLTGALDAQLHPQLVARTAGKAAGSSGGATVIGGFSFRCASTAGTAGTGMTTREALRSALLFVGSTLVLAVGYVWLKRTLGPTAWVEAVGQMALFGPMLAYSVQLGAKNRTLAARAVLFAITMTLMLLSSYAASRWL